MDVMCYFDKEVQKPTNRRRLEKEKHQKRWKTRERYTSYDASRVDAFGRWYHLRDRNGSVVSGREAVELEREWTRQYRGALTDETVWNSQVPVCFFLRIYADSVIMMESGGHGGKLEVRAKARKGV